MNLESEPPLTITPVNCDIPTMEILCQVEISGNSVPNILLSSGTLTFTQGIWWFFLTLSILILYEYFFYKKVVQHD